MNRPSKFDTQKRPTNISLSAELVDQAKRLGINVSQACEGGLSDQVRKALGEEWQRENERAITSWNDWTGKNGLPLEKYRQF